MPGLGDLPSYSVRMMRASLADLPPVEMPDGYSFRMYKPGDEATWLRIHEASDPEYDVTLETFAKEFENRQDELARRQVYLRAPSGHPIGTSTAWYGEGDDDGRGRVHWVALEEAQQGRGLATPLVTRVLYILRDCGHGDAYLVTQTHRLPAIGLYLKFGFVPEIQADVDREHWALVASKLDHPALQVCRKSNP